MSILETAQGILEKSKTPSEMCRIYLQRVDHIYFKFDQNVIKQRNVSGFFLLNYSWILSKTSLIHIKVVLVTYYLGL